jgi:hypothetical protein
VRWFNQWCVVGWFGDVNIKPKATKVSCNHQHFEYSLVWLILLKGICRKPWCLPQGIRSSGFGFPGPVITAKRQWQWWFKEKHKDSEHQQKGESQ